MSYRAIVGLSRNPPVALADAFSFPRERLSCWRNSGMRVPRVLVALVALAVLVGLTTPAARATEIFAFTGKAGDPSVPAGAQVAMTADNTNHTLTVAFSGWGSDPISTFGFNVGGSQGSSISNLSYQSGQPSGSSISTSQAVDGLGTYGYVLSFNGPGFSNPLAPNSTVVLSYTGTLNELDLLTPSQPGPGNLTADVAVHYQDPNLSSNANTFFALGSPAVPAPEPSTICLALSGLASFGFAGVRRLRRRVSAA
jgi:hypothetical protein